MIMRNLTLTMVTLLVACQVPDAGALMRDAGGILEDAGRWLSDAGTAVDASGDARAQAQDAGSGETVELRAETYTAPCVPGESMGRAEGVFDGTRVKAITGILCGPDSCNGATVTFDSDSFWALCAKTQTSLTVTVWR
jgi:hypothetical protein